MSVVFHATLPEVGNYFQPKSVSEAVSLLGKHGETAKILAGGTDLVPLMRNRILMPQCIIDITRIPGLDYIKMDKGGIRIGALTTIRGVETSDLLAREYLVLREAASQMGTTQVKNMGTVVGNLCRASPSADTACALLGLDARLEVARIGKTRIVSLLEFFLGPGKTILKPDEMITEVRIPKLPVATGSTFLRIARVGADLAKVNVATVLTLRDGVCEDVRIALGAIAPTPIRARKAEELLKGQKLDDKLVEKTAETAGTETAPITDLRSTAEYRRELSKVLVKRAIAISIERAKEATRS